MKKVLILICALVITACSTPPRTASELRDGKGSAMGLTKKETHVINRQFAKVVRDVEKKSMKCLRFAYSQTTTHGGVHTSQGTKFYNPKVTSVGRGKVEMTMQWDRLPRAKHDPEGGYYVFLADIEKISKSKTRMTMYGSSFSTWKPIFAAVKGWGQGKNIKCPETP